MSPGNGLACFSISVSLLENVLVCLEARLIPPFNYGRKWGLDSGHKVGPRSARIKHWGFQQANATAFSPGGGRLGLPVYKQHSAIYWNCPPESKSSIAASLPQFKPGSAALPGSAIYYLLQELSPEFKCPELKVYTSQDRKLFSLPRLKHITPLLN